MQQALGILTDSKLGDALDLSKEDPRIVERYGRSEETFQRDGAREWSTTSASPGGWSKPGAR